MFTFGRDKERIDPGTFLRYAMAFGLTVCAMMVYIYPSIRATNLVYEYSTEFRRLADLKERNKTLKLKVATLRSLDYMERRAVEELGFVFPAKGQVVIVAKK